MEPLFLVERRFHPETCRIRQNVLGKGQHALDVQFFESRVVKVALHEGDLLIDADGFSLEGALIDGFSRGTLRIGREPSVAVASQISERRAERPTFVFERRLHPGRRAFGAVVVVELDYRRDYVGEELSGRSLINLLGDGMQPDT